MTHVVGVVVVAEAEAVPRVQPPDVGVEAVLGVADVDHRVSFDTVEASSFIAAM